MKRLLLATVATLTVLFLGWMPAGSAHPLGNFTLNHYAGLELQPHRIRIDYVLDMAEIPAFQEIRRLDLNHNRHPDPAEIAGYPERECERIRPQLEVKTNQQLVTLTLNGSAVEFPPGVGGLSTLRLSCDFQSLADPVGVVSFQDHTDEQRLGWREITVTATDVPIQTQLPSESISHRLRDYPTELLSSPLDQKQVTVQIGSGALVATPEKQVRAASDPLSFMGRSNDAFTQLITLEHLDSWTIAVALGIAFLWGGVHALSPGHGKTIVGAYLVGSRGTAQHALLLGLTSTITHTAGIFALGLVALATSQFILTEQIFPWLSAISGVLVIGIGLNQLFQRLRKDPWGLQKPKHFHDHDHTPIHSDASHAILNVEPTHSNVGDNHHNRESTHSNVACTHHDRISTHSNVIDAHQNRELTNVNVVYAHDDRSQTHDDHQHTHHDHDHTHHDHDHTHHDHDHTHDNHIHAHHDHSHADNLIHDHHHHHDHEHPHVHDHGSGSHSHLPPEKVSWSSLLALGISGGILPCPSALVVLLSAIALGRIGFGLALVTAFSFGLAAVLTGIGLVLVYAGKMFERLPAQMPRIRLLPALSALFITLVGLGITTQAVLQMAGS